jgi:osmoprotectant transport system permease protein
MDVVSNFFQEFWREMLTRTWEHTYLVLISIIIAIAISVPVGILLARTRLKLLSSTVLGIVGIIQTIPSLALVAFAVLLFYGINKAVDANLLPTMGVFPGVLALVLYALLPIMRNTYTGIKQVDPSVIEVARGMGMTERQILFEIQLPLALPVIMAGIRISTVWTIGIATLVGLIGAGGTGALIFMGLRSYKMDYVLAGTLPAAGLALVAGGLLTLVEWWLTPRGAREQAKSPA